MIHIYWLIVFFLLGTIFGSFFNVVGLRLPKKQPFHIGRSHCPTCHKTLQWYELIPVLSFIIQRGKCKGCSGKISPIYPVVEFLTGGLFAFSYWQLDFQVELITALLLMSMLMIIFVSDITYMIIPNKILLFFLPFLLILRIIHPLDPWYDAIIGGVVGYTLIAIIIIVSKGGMGAGDMKLFGVLGIIFGISNTMLSFLIAAFLGAIIGSILILLKRLKKKQPIPFGPYIVVGAIITYFYGSKIIQLYFNLL